MPINARCIIMDMYMKKRESKLEGFFTWPKLAIFAILMGVYTALMAMFVPDGNSFHDIAVTAEWWVLPAILIILSCKKPLEAALKVFVFFLISQPLVYLMQVPFNSMGWGLFGYYKYWFMITLLTFPGAYVGWFIKKDKWYSGVILAVMTVLLVLTGVSYVRSFSDSFPNHLISTIYCFALIPVLIFTIFKDRWPRIISSAITVVAIVVVLILPTQNDSFDIQTNLVFEDNNIVFVGEPRVINSDQSDVTLRATGIGYFVRVLGEKGSVYSFSIEDDERTYEFEYYYDDDMRTIVVELINP